MNTRTEYKHISRNSEGIPVISGTDTKVIEIVLDVKAYGWSPEEIHFQHPYLTLGQIHSALAYYWDYAEELDADIEKRLRAVNKIKRQIGPSDLRNKLKKRGIV